MAYSGRFNVLNESKYRGDANKVTYRSQWEYVAMRFLESNKNIAWWNSEESIIQYLSPVDGKMHRYFVDLTFENLNGDRVLVEIKPFNQTQPPKQQRKTQKYLKSVKTYLINQAKWKAAERVCKKRGWKFRIWTENELRALGLKI